MTDQCSICKEEFEYGEMYEYRGAISCEACFDELEKVRNFERAEIIEESRHKTDRFKGLDLSDSTIGKANKRILAAEIEIAQIESERLKAYEQQ